jgi:hypothetical protein
MAQNFTTDVTQWQSVAEVLTAGSNNLATSGSVYDSQYQRTVEIEGAGDTFKEVLIGKFEKGQNVYCYFNPWVATAASPNTVIFRLRKIVNGVITVIYQVNAGGTIPIPSKYNFVVEDDAKYYFGGRADIGGSINGIFTYNCINEEKVETIEQSILGINNSFNSYRGITDKNLGVLDDTVSRKIGYDTWLPSPSGGWDIYPMEIKAGDVLTLFTSVGNRQCYTVSSLTDSGSDYRLDGIALAQNINNVLTATQDAIGIMFYGVGAVHVTKKGSIDNAIDNDVSLLSKKILQNNNIMTYNADKIAIDNDARTITFSGNIAIVDTQGNTITLETNGKSASFNAEVPTGGFSGTSMAVLVYKSDKTLAVKQYNKLASTDYALIGLKFSAALGSRTTASSTTKIVNYISLLPVEITNSNPTEKMVIIEKRDSLVGLGNNQFAGYKKIGTLTPGQTYYVYVNNFKHTSAEAGYLFAINKNNSYLFGITVGKELPTKTPVYTFVAEDAVYSYGGRCDIDDSINIEFLSREKDTFDVATAKELNRNNAFAPLLKEVTVSVSKNAKLGGFLHITDMHSNLASLKEMVRIKSALGLSNAITLNGGDNVNGWPRTNANQAVIDEYMSIFATNNIYHVVGQHEVGFAPSADPDAIIGRSKADVYSHQETFNRYFAPLKDGWGLSSLDKCYYYKDFGNVRLITLYHYNRPEIDDPNDSDYYKYQRALVWYGTEQLQWFADTLGSMSAGKVAIVFCHQPTKVITPLSSSKFQSGAYASVPNNITTDDPITEIITAFNNKTQLVKTYTPTDTTKYLVADGFEESVNVDFSNAEGAFGFMIMGDNHFDDVGKIGNILCLCLTSCGVCTDGVITTNTGYISDYIINAFGVGSTKVELGRVGQQYFCGTLRDIERLSYT